MKRIIPAVSVLTTAALASGCQAARVLTGNCQVEVVEVVLPATLDVGALSATTRFVQSREPASASMSQVEVFERVVVRGQPGNVGSVAWTATAEEAREAGIPALTLTVRHKAALTPGEVMRVEGMQVGGRWETSSSPPRLNVLVNFDRWSDRWADIAGTLTVLRTAPVALRFDVTARDAAGAAVRLRGDASFNRRTKRVPCFT